MLCRIDTLCWCELQFERRGSNVHAFVRSALGKRAAHDTSVLVMLRIGSHVGLLEFEDSPCVFSKLSRHRPSSVSCDEALMVFACSFACWRQPWE